MTFHLFASPLFSSFLLTLFKSHLPVAELNNSFPCAAVNIRKDDVTSPTHVVFQVLGKYKEYARELSEGWKSRGTDGGAHEYNEWKTLEAPSDVTNNRR